jgi:hypothetical protein
MDLELLTVSSLTTEPDNLTALHQNSGLQTTHESRRTDTGFLIREDRLPPNKAMQTTRFSMLLDGRLPTASG